ncbi:MAG: carbonic anhydrase [Anaerolineae bacterium]|nr:carbonic anhydrase [Anaerolineae bacterium]
MQTQNKTTQAAITPAEALAMLREGNARFVANRRAERDLPRQVQLTGEGQYPFAIVLGCVDSRVSPELVFDQGIGDIFSARIAGNFINEDILGSMEFACKVAGARLILVLGHSQCGAIMGAVDNVELGNLTGMLTRLKPAVDRVAAPAEARTSQNAAFVQQVAEMNVALTVEAIQQQSPVLREMLENGEVMVAGAMYDVETGEVTFL